MKRDKCAVGTGKSKDIYATKAEARAAVTGFRRTHGAGKVYRCVGADHYHITRGYIGRKGTKGARKR